MLQVSLRENVRSNAKKNYFFRSSNNGVLTTDKLVAEMATFNTTITEADTLGVLNVMKRILVKYVNLGYVVHTPIGYFHASASGSTDEIDAQFLPNDDTNNHEIALLYCPSTEVGKQMADGIEVERVSNRLLTTPSIDVVKDAATGEIGRAKAGDTVSINGDYLKYLPEDTLQGVFLSKDNTETRLTYCTHNASKKIEVRIPADTAPGNYEVLVRCKPSSMLLEAAWKKNLEVTA